MLLPVIPKPIIYKNIISTIIAPHGITDIIHAKENNNLKELFFLNSCMLSSSYYLTYINLNNIIDYLFIYSSIIHFSNDFYFKVKYKNLFISSVLLFISIYYNYDIFFTYMICWHVPKHYKTNYNIIKKNKLQNYIIIGLTTIIMYYLSIIIPITLYSKVFDISKAIIISHIIYEEKYIYNLHSSITSSRNN